MLQKLKFFIKSHHDGQSPLLLAFSGGPDSSALLALLLKAQKEIPFSLHVAHVDHGWREESGREAALLKELVESLGCLFHMKKLESCSSEETAREGRLSFFRELSRIWGFQAVFMAHHADDLAETVLKRLFEGASLNHLEGIKEEKRVDGLLLWRPLLDFTKEEISSWKVFEPLYDSTNADERFLRNRLRLSLIPSLEEKFGKSVKNNLLRLSRRARELDEYLDFRLKNYESCLIESPLGVCFDFSVIPRELAFEWPFFIKKVMSKKGVSVSDEILQNINSQLFKFKSALVIPQGGGRWLVDRGRLFWYEDKKLKWQSQVFSGEGSCRLGWKEAWRGEVAVSLPSSPFTLEEGKPSMKMAFSSKKLGAFWSEHKVPVFMREKVPVVLVRGLVWAEFLTGKEPKNEGSLLLQLRLAV